MFCLRSVSPISVTSIPSIHVVHAASSVLREGNFCLPLCVQQYQPDQGVAFTSLLRSHLKGDNRLSPVLKVEAIAIEAVTGNKHKYMNTM